MKKTLLKKALSFGLSFSLIASCFAADASLFTSATSPSEIESDNFESYTASSPVTNVWETIPMLSSGNTDLVAGSLSLLSGTGIGSSSALSNSYITAYAAVRTYLNTLKEEYTPSGLTAGYSFYANISNYAYDKHFAIVPYFNAQDNDYFCMDFNYNATTGLFTFRRFTPANPVYTVTEISRNTNVTMNLTNSAGENYDPWVKYSYRYEYEFTDSGCTLTFHLDVSNSYTEIEDFYVYSLSGASKEFRVGFTSDVKAKTTYPIDNVQYSVTGYDTLATGFIAEYSEFLSKTTYLSNDVAAYNQALAEYSQLPEEARAFLTTQKAQLDNARNKIIKVIPVANRLSFDEDYNNLAWETIKTNNVNDEAKADAASVLTKQSFATSATETVYTPTVASVNKSTLVNIPTAEAWQYKRLENYEFDMKYTAGSFDNAAAFYPFVFDNPDGKYPYTLGIQYQKDAGGTGTGFYVRGMGNSDAYTASTIAYYVARDTTINTVGWLHVNVTYDYSNYPTSLGCTFTFTDENNYIVETQKIIYTLNFDNTELTRQYFRIGFGSTYGNGQSNFKNLTCEFENSDTDIAVTFIMKYKSLLEAEQFTSDMNAEFTTMCEEFNSLSAISQSEVVSNGYIDNITQLAKEAGLANSANAFLAEYDALLRLQKISTDTEETLNTAWEEYEALDSVAKFFLPEAKEKLILFLGELNIVRDEDDYSSFNVQFDNGINPFRNVMTPSKSAVNEIVDDPENSDNKVLKLQGQDDVFTLKYWPTFGAVRNVSFKMYMPSYDLFTKTWILGSYEDINNYYAVGYGPYSESTTSNYSMSKSDGTELMNLGNNSSDTRLRINCWSDVTISFTDSAMAITVQDAYGHSTSWSGSYARGGSFGFGYFSSYNHIGQPCYIDDIVVNFYAVAGDFDVNEDTAAIDVYYSGNSMIAPDDSLVLSGNKLFSTTNDEISIARVADTDKTALKNTANTITVVEQQDYSNNGENKSEWVQSAEYTFDAENAVTVSAIQRSNMTLTTVVPKTFETGVYAVKLYPKVEGESVAYRYINIPQISFITGNDGDIASQGGTARIIGSNLVPTGVAEDVSVRFINSATGAQYNLPVAIIYEDDAYSLTVNIPSDMPYADYEVYVHNGYGDNTCWSAPCTIKVAQAVRDSWNLETNRFNVKEYGAVGNGKMNDTAAFVSALQAASENGGTVYVPAGTYVVTTTLAIPERVCLAGESNTTTVIDFSAHRWIYGEVPDTLFSIIGNVEIRDLSISATRAKGAIVIKDQNTDSAFYADTSSDNVYLTNLRFRFTPSAGPYSAGGGYGVAIAGVTKAEMLASVCEEGQGALKFSFRAGTSNLQLDNFQILTDDLFNYIMSSGAAVTRVAARQVQIKNSIFKYYTMMTSSYGFICEESEGGFGPASNGFYFARNYLHDTFGNNRELMTTDGTAIYKDTKIQFIGNRADLMQQYFGTSELDDTLYLLNNVKTTAYNTLKDYNIMVTVGQGVGQLRKITESGSFFVSVNGVNVRRTWVKVESPFTVAPNRKSTISVTEPRDKWFFVNNTFYEGAASGSYGIMINAVYDGNEFGRHEGQYFQANQGQIWYITLLNQRHYEPSYVHNTSLGTPGSNIAAVTNRDHRASVSMQTSKTPYSSLAFVIKKCSFDGYGYSFDGQKSESLSGLVLEHCLFENRNDNPVMIGLVDINSSLLIRDNNFLTDGEIGLSSSALADFTTINKYGYNTVLIINSDYTPEAIILGDVNLDGNVTLKDSSLIRYYLNGDATLTEEQIARADVDANETISLKDSTIIRYWVLTNFTDINLENVEIPDE